MGKPGAARPRVVCCALPLLRSSAKVLVISSRKRDGKWVVPKGGYEASDKTLEAAAAREAYEEGGIQGIITKYVTTVNTPTATIHFYEMDVTKLDDKWPESKERLREWVDYTEACRRLTWKPELLQGLMLCSLASKR